MNTKLFVVGAIAAALVGGTAMAQTPTAATRTEINSASVDQAYKGQWRIYKMIGLDVYNQNDEKVGDISELLVDQTGKIQTAILGVGGFLGVGGRLVDCARRSERQGKAGDDSSGSNLRDKRHVANAVLLAREIQPRKCTNAPEFSSPTGHNLG